ncbi:hypothetical protein SELMODRAFT_411468 [Selaginella moellendorffii]|uniref:Uncharacterized protein n=1 Tax=Selaginella moellendorffii TaxID=88036 RepID=D8RI17_SELML|nr:hypothetical protein SELMODRAFT_411468 [Selaginella moellendorffii]
MERPEKVSFLSRFENGESIFVVTSGERTSDAAFDGTLPSIAALDVAPCTTRDDHGSSLARAILGWRTIRSRKSTLKYWRREVGGCCGTFANVDHRLHEGGGHSRF